MSDPRSAGLAARIDESARRGAPARASDAPFSPSETPRERAEDVLDLDGGPIGTLTVRGLEVPYDVFRDRELDLLQRWGDARVDHESSRALERAVRELPQALQAHAEVAQAADEGSAAAGEAGAAQETGLPVEDVSLPPLAAPGAAPATGEARPGADKAQTEPEQAAHAREGYLALPPEAGLEVDFSA